MSNIQYISEFAALNLPCELETCGDWHYNSVDWNNVNRIGDLSPWGMYGISERFLKETGKQEYVSNHIRAVLDLIKNGKFDIAAGMKNDFICNDKYNNEIFEKVCMLKKYTNWDDVNRFMLKEYGRAWKKFLSKGVNK